MVCRERAFTWRLPVTGRYSYIGKLGLGLDRSYVTVPRMDNLSNTVLQLFDNLLQRTTNSNLGRSTENGLHGKNREGFYMHTIFCSSKHILTQVNS